MKPNFTKYWLAVALLGLLQVSIAQVSRVEFGKNRIQYHDDFDQWILYESQNFITYWYGKARNHGVATVKLAEQDHDEILDLIEHRINEKIEILVYSDVSDQKQSNIGSDETFVSSSGRTKLEGTKLFVYFNGDHEDLRTQIRKGVAEVFLNSMFYGSNFQELVQSRSSNNIPVWFTEGLIEYIGRSWDSESDDDLRNIFNNTRRKKTFKRLSGTYPVKVGQSIWHYIAGTYGRSEISNLLYLTRINRNVEDAFLYVFGIPFEDLTEQWLDSNTKRYAAEKLLIDEQNAEGVVKYKKRKRVPITELRYSPDGTHLAIVDNQISKTRIILKNLDTGDQKKLFKHGFRNNIQETDVDYPSIAWHPNGNGLYILYEARNEIWLEYHDLETGDKLKQIIPERYDRVYSMDILNDQDLIFSALSNGMVDLFLYKTNTRQSTPFTQDIYDDLEVRIMTMDDGSKGIVFASNRPDAIQQKSSLDTVLPFANFNLFMLKQVDDQMRLFQLSRSEEINLRNPVPTGSKSLSFLSDANGVTNRETAKLSSTTVSDQSEVIFLNGDTSILANALISPEDSTIVSIREIETPGFELVDQKSAYQLRNIIQYDVSSVRGKSAEVYKVGDDFRIIEGDLSYSDAAPTGRIEQPEEEEKAPTKQQEEEERRTEKDYKNEEVIRSSEDGGQYLFQSRFDDMDSEKTERIMQNELRDSRPLNTTSYLDRRGRVLENTEIDRLRIIPYRLKFQIHNLTTNVDNSLLFGGLDSYAGFKQEFEPVPPGILIKAEFKDLFEDYSFKGGVRFPTSFNGTEYFLVFDDNKKRIDRQYAFYRKTTTDNQLVNGTDPQRTRNTVLLGHYRLKYPLDIYNSVRATGTLRQDKFTFLATDRASIDQPNLTNQRIGLRLDYVFDNAIDIDLNIRSGTKFLFSIEAVKRFIIDTSPLNVSFSQGFMTVLGLDARHYLNFGKHSVLAVRGAAGTSFGSEKVLYYLGGSDNTLIPKFNQDIPQPEGNFAYQTITPNLRGFDYNIRNGSTFALINAELRIPIIKYLSRRPIRLSFLRHLQLVGFADIGAAWEGISPFDEENPINILNLSNPPTVFLQVNYFRDPLVAGYGVGIRTQLFGYFLRFDYAWGVETRIIQDPKIHFSLGLDF